MSQIFVVEDDAAIRGELLQVLERNGFQTAHCERFDHVVEDVLAADPDLVLLDLTLPGTDGQFVCRELRAESTVPIVVLTSRVINRLRGTLEKIGVTGYLTTHRGRGYSV